MSEPPRWRQAFDAVDRAVAPHAESFVRTPGFSTGVAVLRRAQVLARESARGLTARAWHLLNLPAGSDVSRLRAQIGALDREVRRLTVQLENERRRPDPAEEAPDADRAQPAGRPRTRPARRGTQRPAGP
jgi:hypothetical protein